MIEQIAPKAQQGFITRFGFEPAGVWSAPGRVNLIGEHTDYNQGFVLPVAIDRVTCAAVALRGDNQMRVASTFDGEVHQIALSEISNNRSLGWAAYPFGVAYAIQKLAEKDFGTGFDIFIDSNVPVGAGLSSSAALESAVALAINELWNAGLTKRQLARAGQIGENEIVGAPTGIMDQTASIFGSFDHAVFLDCRSLESETVRLGCSETGLEILVIDTKVAHRLSDGGYAARREDCERGAELMGVASLRDLGEADLDRAQQSLDDQTFRRVRHIITENARVLQTVSMLKSKGISAIGRLMLQSHASMRDDFEISVEELDLAVEVAMQNGAIGARMTGGGFGGAAIAVVPVELAEQLKTHILTAFADRGYLEPEIFAVAAANGAQRVFKKGIS